MLIGLGRDFMEEVMSTDSILCYVECFVRRAGPCVMNNCVDMKFGNCFEYALVYNQIDIPQLYLYLYIYTSTSTCSFFPMKTM